MKSFLPFFYNLIFQDKKFLRGFIKIVTFAKDDESENQCCSAFSIKFKHSINCPRENSEIINFSQEFPVEALNDIHVTSNSASEDRALTIDNLGDSLHAPRVKKTEETHL